MRTLCPRRPLLAGLVAFASLAATVAAQEIPMQILQNWQNYNNAGWILLNRGDYDRAEHRFRMAIEEIRPYSKADQRLLARSYADLAQGVLSPGTLRRCRAAGEVGIERPRVASPR